MTYMMAESDDDIWEYKSLKRTKRSDVCSSQPSSRQPPSKKLRISNVSSQIQSNEHGRTCRNTNIRARGNVRSCPLILKSEEETSNLELLTQSNKLQSLKIPKKPMSQIKLESFSPAAPSRTTKPAKDHHYEDRQMSSKTPKNKSRCTAAVNKRAKQPTKSSCKILKEAENRKKKSTCCVKSVKMEVNDNNTDRNRRILQGYCPFCQMPFGALVLDSPERHVAECLSKPLQAENECPHGIACDVTIESHYRKFRHCLLAEARATLPNEARSKMCEQQELKTQHQKGMTQKNEQQEPLSSSRKMSDPSSHDAISSLAKSLQNSTAVRQHPVTKGEKYATEGMSNATGNTSSNVVSSQIGSLNSIQKSKSMEKAVQFGLKAAAEESKLVSLEQGSEPQKNDGTDQVHCISSDEDIFAYSEHSCETLSVASQEDTQKGCEQPVDDNDDTQSSAMSELSTSIFADAGPVEPQQLTAVLTSCCTQTASNSYTHCTESSESTSCIQAKDLLPSTCQTKTSNFPLRVASKGNRQAQNLNLDFDHCSQVDISIKVTPCEKADHTKQSSDNLCTTPSFFKMKAKKAHRIQVMVEENQDNESANSDADDSSVSDSAVPSVLKTNIKHEAEDQEKWSHGCLTNKNERGGESNVDSHHFMQNGVASEVQGSSISAHSTTTVGKECSSDNEPLTKQESVASQDQKRYSKKVAETSKEGTLSQLVRPVISALSSAVPSNSLRQSSLASYFGLGAVKKENLSQEGKQERSLHATETATASNAMPMNSDPMTQSSHRSYKSHSRSRNGRWSKSSSQYDDDTGHPQSQRAGSSQRLCPFYKKIQGTSFVVDAFRYGDIPGCTAYFLSHFHYDHYGGLTKHFKHLIYCSQITANLVRARIRVEAKYLRPLPMNEACVISGVEVTLLEANHCPGAVLFLFHLSDGRVFLHTGDFRADSAMEQLPQLRSCHIDQLFLDTTYLDPQYDFPTQAEVIEYTAQIAVDVVKRNNKTLLVCGTYTIGKEKIFIAIAEAVGCKVFVAKDKKNILDCLENSRLQSMLTLDKNATRLHVVTMATLTNQSLKEYLSKFSGRYDAVVAFKPTGWTHSDKKTNLQDIKPSRSGPVSIYGVPYSEHSSYSELRRFVQFIRPNRIIPTVNVGSAASRNAMNEHFKTWLSEEIGSSQGRQLHQPRNSSILNWFK
ncbi:DNA cross-link repair 1A protein-like [Acanthaster planci]|uniref:DNA cross-link repair 1A protein n=1 Tax=Acanthaster planci TaxID=133434 RepID=A0A8B7YH81_ACAPL|nr:DNA cross-link repair 1A protein-like [Acanthaster planci]